MEKKIEVAFKASERIIADIEISLENAISRGDWATATSLAAFVSGANQIKTIFELSLK